MQGRGQAWSPVNHCWQTESFLMKAFALDVPEGEGVSLRNGSGRRLKLPILAERTGGQQSPRGDESSTGPGIAGGAAGRYCADHAGSPSAREMRRNRGEKRMRAQPKMT